MVNKHLLLILGIYTVIADLLAMIYFCGFRLKGKPKEQLKGVLLMLFSIIMVILIVGYLYMFG